MLMNRIIFFAALFLFCLNLAAASFPNNGYFDEKTQEEEVFENPAYLNSQLLGTNYTVTMGDGTNGTFQTDFVYHTPGSPAPGAWYTLANGSGLMEGDSIIFTDINEKYKLIYSSYDGFLVANGSGISLGSYSYFAEVPIPDESWILYFLGLGYISYIFYKKNNTNSNS